MPAPVPVVNLIQQGAIQRGLDPRAVIAVARQEGLSGRVGDNGTSFGPFQLHHGGAFPTGRVPRGQEQAWAMSPQGINYALDEIEKVAKGLTRRAAIEAIVSKFERPANPSREIENAFSAYGGGLPDSARTLYSTRGGTGGVAGLDPRVALAINMNNQIQGLDVAPLVAGLPGRSLPPGSAVSPSPSGPVGSYKFLAPASGVDITRVDPRLLSAVNALGQSLGKPVEILSGYRDAAKQAALWDRYVQSGFNQAYIAAKPGQSNHNRGQAIDLALGGVPIAKAVGAGVLARYGLHNPVPGDLPHTTLMGVAG